MATTTRLIGLGLRGGDTQVTTAFRQVVKGSLRLFCDALEIAEERCDWDTARVEIERCREQFMTVDGEDSVAALSDACFKACRDALSQVGAHQAVKRTELRALITHVRGAVSALAGDNDTFSSRLDDSTGRMEALVDIDDLHMLKEHLAIEVSSLKQIAAERQESWTAAVAEFQERVQTLESELAASQMEAAHDPLTNVANRRPFERRLGELLQSPGARCVVAVLDLDDFKQINDRYGHQAGDQALVSVAQAIRSQIRSEDLLARIGGDEFAVLLPGLTLRAAESRFRTGVSTLCDALTRPDGRRFTVSCGIAEFSAGDTVASLMERADRALYETKRQGKNRVGAIEAPFLRDLKKH